jgi:hypothetical protein
MSFRVRPDALEEFGRSLSLLSGDARKAKDYIAKYTGQVDDKSGYALGAFYSLGVIRIGESVQKNLERLERLSAASSKELDHCADVYRRTERKNAERMDQAYPK